MMKRLRFISQRWGRHILSGCITIICLVVFFKQINFLNVLEAFAQFEWIYLILGIGSLALGYLFRIIRWSMMLQATAEDVTIKSCAAPFLGSIALNNILPFRIGDVVRAFVFPDAMGIRRTTAASSLFVERLIDLITLLTCLAIGSLAVKSVIIPLELKSTAIILALLGGVLLMLGFLWSKVLGDIFDRLSQNMKISVKKVNFYAVLGASFHAFNIMSRPKILFTTLIISMLIWIGEAGAFYFILFGAGIESSPEVALLVMSMATLSTLVPSSPGYVGPFHLAVFSAISLVGGTEAQAGSYAIIVHLALWVPTTLAGVVAIWANPTLFRSAKAQAINFS